MTFRRNRRSSKDSNGFTWTAEELADKFLGKLVEVINLTELHRANLAVLTPIVQVGPDDKNSHLDEIGYWNPKLKGYQQTWRNYRTKTHRAIIGEDIRDYNPMLVVDVIRMLTPESTRWALVVLANEKFYSVDLMNTLIVNGTEDV